MDKNADRDTSNPSQGQNNKWRKKTKGNWLTQFHVEKVIKMAAVVAADT